MSKFFSDNLSLNIGIFQKKSILRIKRKQLKENELIYTYSKQLQFLVNPDWIEKDVSTQAKWKVILRFGAMVKFPSKSGGAYYISCIAHKDVHLR